MTVKAKHWVKAGCGWVKAGDVFEISEEDFSAMQSDLEVVSDLEVLVEEPNVDNKVEDNNVDDGNIDGYKVDGSNAVGNKFVDSKTVNRLGVDNQDVGGTTEAHYEETSPAENKTKPAQTTKRRRKKTT